MLDQNLAVSQQSIGVSPGVDWVVKRYLCGKFSAGDASAPEKIEKGKRWGHGSEWRLSGSEPRKGGSFENESIRLRQIQYLLAVGDRYRDWELITKLVTEIVFGEEVLADCLTVDELDAVSKILQRHGSRVHDFVMGRVKSFAKGWEGGQVSLGLSNLKNFKLDNSMEVQFPDLQGAPHGGGASVDAEASGLEGAPHRGGAVSGELHQKKQKQRNKQYCVEGISAYGRTMLSSAGVLLKQRYARSQLGMITLTLPSVSEEQLVVVCREFSKMTNEFLTWFRKVIKSCGAEPVYAYCVELQEKRGERDGGRPYPHLHVVFVCRDKEMKSKKFYLTKDQIRDEWARVLQRRLGEGISKSALTRVEIVRKDVARYVSKYVSKGSQSCKKAVENGYGELLPRRWWGMSRKLNFELRKAHDELELKGEDAQIFLSLLSEWKSKGIVKYKSIVIERTLENGEIEKRVVGVSGYFCVSYWQKLVENRLKRERWKIARRRRRMVRRIQRQRDREIAEMRRQIEKTVDSPPEGCWTRPDE